MKIYIGSLTWRSRRKALERLWFCEVCELALNNNLTLREKEGHKRIKDWYWSELQNHEGMNLFERLTYK